VFDEGHNGLVVKPMSVTATGRLFLWELSCGVQISKQLTYDNIISPDGSIADLPLALTLNSAGLDVVMTPKAWTVVDGLMRRAKRFFAPYEFRVPEQFKDLSTGMTVDAVQGPYADEIYASEIKRTMKRLAELDLLEDPERPDKFSLYKFQAEDVCRLALKRRAYLGHEMGLGKAQPLTARVLTPNGWTTMGKIHIGDEVIGANGKPTKVVGTFPQGIRQIYRVTFNDGSSTECDENHIWAVNTAVRRNRGNDFQTMSLKEIMAKGLMRGRDIYLHYIPIVAPVEFPKSDLPLDPYLLGALIGDGCLKNSSGFSTADEEMLTLLRERLPKEATLVRRAKYDWGIVFNPGHKKARRNNPITDVIRSLGLNVCSKDKFIPETYKTACVEDRLEMLRGLMDTDGHVRPKDNHLEITTASEQLAKDIRDLVCSLGGVAFLKLKTIKQYPLNVYYRLTIIMPEGMNPFRLTRKAEAYHPRVKYQPVRYIKRIEKLDAAPAQCIKVEAENGLYVTDDYIVTHNTIIAVATARVLDNRFVLVVAPAAAIGTMVSGWRHEIARQGVPEENIHLIEKPEDLPTDKSQYPDNGEKHFFLVDYTTLSKDKTEWNSFPCPKCHSTVPAENKGVCKDAVHDYRTAGGHYVENFSKLTCCPICLDKAYRANGCKELDRPSLDKLAKFWTGNYCDPHEGGCGFRAKVRVLPVGRAKHGFVKANPVWKYVTKGMFGTMFVDESHMIRNIASKRSLAVQMLRGIRNVYIMTGTLMANYVSDTFWQLHRLCPCGLFPIGGKYENYLSYDAESSKQTYGSKLGYDGFVKRFEGGTVVQGRGRSKVTRIAEPAAFWRMMSCFMVRRRAEDPEVEGVIQLPPAAMHHEFIEMDSSHKAIYGLSTGEFRNQIQTMIASNAGAAYGAGPTTISASALLPVNEADIKMKLHQLRLMAVCPDQDPAYGESMTTKDARMLELVKGQMNHPDGRLHKTVIFTIFVDHMTRLARLFKDEGIPALVVGGGMGKYEKWMAVDSWRTTDESAVLISTIKTFGTAVNLTPLSEDFDCDMVVFGAPEWSPGPMEQAWKRVHRIGQRSPMNVHYLYHADTIEQYIDELVQAKLKVINAAIDRRNYERDGDVANISAHDIALRVLGGGGGN
jgi:hypothetical protein